MVLIIRIYKWILPIIRGLEGIQFYIILIFGAHFFNTLIITHVLNYYNKWVINPHHFCTFSLRFLKIPDGLLKTCIKIYKIYWNCWTGRQSVWHYNCLSRLKVIILFLFSIWYKHYIAEVRLSITVCQEGIWGISPPP